MNIDTPENMKSYHKRITEEFTFLAKPPDTKEGVIDTMSAMVHALSRKDEGFFEGDPYFGSSRLLTDGGIEMIQGVALGYDTGKLLDLHYRLTHPAHRDTLLASSGEEFRDVYEGSPPASPFVLNTQDVYFIHRALFSTMRRISAMYENPFVGNIFNDISSSISHEDAPVFVKMVNTNDVKSFVNFLGYPADNEYGNLMLQCFEYVIKANGIDVGKIPPDAVDKLNNHPDAFKYSVRFPFSFTSEELVALTGLNVSDYDDVVAFARLTSKKLALNALRTFIDNLESDMTASQDRGSDSDSSYLNHLRDAEAVILESVEGSLQ